MKQIHPSLQGLVLSGYNESVNEIQSRLESVTTSVNQLNDSIQKRVESQNLDFLLVEVDQLIALQPRRKDMIALRNQLLERNHKLKMIRDEAFKKGKVLFLNQDYEGCVNELKRIDLSVTNDEIVKLQELADYNSRRAQMLYAEIRERIKSKKLIGLTVTVNELVALKSHDKKILKLQDQLVERDLKNVRRSEIIINESLAFCDLCQFENALERLETIETELRSEPINEIIQKCKDFSILRKEALTAKNKADSINEIDLAITKIEAYIGNLNMSQVFNDAEIMESIELLKSKRKGMDYKTKTKVFFHVYLLSAVVLFLLTLLSIVWQSQRRSFVIIGQTSPATLPTEKPTILEVATNNSSIPEQDSAVISPSLNPLALKAVKLFNGNILVPLDIYLKSIASDVSQFEKAKEFGVEVQIPDGISIPKNPSIKSLLTGGKSSLWIKSVAAKTVSIGLPKELNIKDIENACFAISEPSDTNGDTIQYFSPVNLELENKQDNRGLSGASELRFYASNGAFSHININRFVDNSTLFTKSIGYYSTAEDYVIEDSSEIIEKSLKQDKPDYRLFVKPLIGTAPFLVFNNYSCFFPVVFIERHELQNKIEQIRLRRSNNTLKDMEQVAKYTNLLQDRGTGVNKDSNYIIYPDYISQADTKNLFATLSNHIEAFTPTHLNAISENTQFSRAMLQYLNVSFSEGDQKTKVNQQFKRITDQIKKIQTYLVNSPPSFYVFYNVKSNSATTNIANQFPSNPVKVVIYSYTLGSKTYVSRSEPETTNPVSKTTESPSNDIESATNEKKTSSQNTNIEWVGTKAGERRIIKVQNIEVPFRWCPPGEFLMGSPNLEKDRDDGFENQSQVTLTKGFWIMETEVTQELYKTVIGSNPSQFQGDKNLPVENVSWDDADEFCKKLNQQLVGNFRITLPTEAQWEYACRAGSTTATAFGDLLNNDRANFNGYGTTPVASYLSNLWGIYDMHGNVSELCADWFIAKLQGGIDPVGPKNGVFHVSRGGRWNNSGSGCRSARREMVSSSYKSNGFRLALISTESEDK